MPIPHRLYPLFGVAILKENLEGTGRVRSTFNKIVFFYNN